MSFLCLPLLSQDNSLIALSVEGEVLHFGKHAKKVLVKPGMSLEPGGKINLKENSVISLLVGQETVNIDQPGDHELQPYFKKYTSANKFGFSQSFWQLVSDGLQSSENEKSLKAYARQFEPEQALGFGAKKYDVSLETSFGGKAGGEDIRFKWKSYSQDKPIYHFSIRHTASDQLIFKALTYDTAFVVNFENLAFKKGETYDWEIEVENDQKDADGFFITKSPKIQFDYEPNSLSQVQERLNRIDKFQNADQLKKEWMEAVALEEKGFYYQAYKRYQKLRKEHPDNLLIKKLYAAFLARRGFLSEANQALRE